MQNIIPILNEIVERLLQSEQPIAKIVLFGSYAKETARDDSDIDLMVIIDNDTIVKTFTERMDRVLTVRRALRNVDFAKDLFVYSRREYGIAKESKHWFLEEIEQTGKVLYERN